MMRLLLLMGILVLSEMRTFTLGHSFEDHSSQTRDYSGSPLLLSKYIADRHLRRNRKEGSRGPSTRRAVSFKERCSPRTAYVTLRQDAPLLCEMWAPVGSAYRWLKNDIEIRNSRTKMLGTEGREHVMSMVFIDCASPDDEGQYTLEIKDPSGNIYARHFSVKLLDEVGDIGSMCSLSRHMTPFVPRIYEFAFTVVGQIGDPLILPCRYQGRLLVVQWYFQNQKLSSDNYVIRPNGDLEIKDLEPYHRGMFSCTVRSRLVKQLNDRISTYVYPLARQTTTEEEG